MKSLEIAVNHARKLGMVPRIHPNGFLQLDLVPSKVTRLHIFDEMFPRQKVSTPVHDHEFDLESDVRLGTLININYDVLPVITRNGTHQKWTVMREPYSEETKLITTVDEFMVTEASRQVLTPGQSYKLCAPQFHESQHEGRTLTVMRKLGYVAGQKASVMIPVGQAPDNDFKREAHDTGDLWDVIYETQAMVA